MLALIKKIIWYIRKQNLTICVTISPVFPIQLGLYINYIYTPDDTKNEQNITNPGDIVGIVTTVLGQLIISLYVWLINYLKAFYCFVN